MCVYEGVVGLGVAVVVFLNVLFDACVCVCLVLSVGVLCVVS